MEAREAREAAWRQKLQEEELREMQIEQELRAREAAAMQKEAERLQKEVEERKKEFRRQRHAAGTNRRNDPADGVYDSISEAQPPLRLRRSPEGRIRSRSPTRRLMTEAEDRIESRKAGTREPWEP